MARINTHVQSHALRVPDWTALFVTAVQIGVLSALALFIILAVVNTILGTPTTQPSPPANS